MADRSTFYISTPIYYPNAEPHLGHVYTTLCADTVARYHRLRGDDTFFLTGTDEHGIKMVKTAAAQGIEPKVLVDRVVKVFEDIWREVKVSHDDFIRTSSDRHKRAVTKIVEKLVANDDIYLGSYEGWYDEGQEEFVTETEAKANEFKSSITGRPLTRYTEPTYFFRLKKYAPRVLEYIQSNPDFIQPEARRNEVISKLKQGVEDLSVSRATLKWGIPLPHDPGHVLYVWIDALSNYITALGYASGDEAQFRQYWPADVHLIGKEILWFHTVYWPAILFSLDLPLPRQVFAHGWWTSGGRKMGKSLGNFIDLDKLRSVIDTYSLDALRYYLLRAAPFGSDLDWTDADFAKSFNELANVVGNCLNRTIKMVGRYRDGVLPAVGETGDADAHLVEQTGRLAVSVTDAYARLELQQCALLPVELARATNGYIDATAPFSLAKDPAKASRLDTVLNRSAQAIKNALVALLPVLPEKALAGLQQLNVPVEGRPLAELLASELPPGHKLGDGQPLFPKVDVPK
ncbi:MAG TPA: methionine--tRNA ligase [Tepidisphaeraceae bacterium]|nr:methionine--tRNA ligase [Tepidisphaeraceae bacterium]